MDESSFIIGVDLDGVVGDFYGAMRTVAAEWLDKPLETLPEEVSFGLTEWKLEACGGYERLHRFAVTQRNIFREMKPLKDAPVVLRRLSAHGFRIRIITHRLFLKYSHQESVRQTVDWLDYYDIPYWDLCFMKDKEAVGAHVYIDDSPDNIRRLRQLGYRTIVFANSTNRELAPPRAESWLAVERLVLNFYDDWKTGTLALFDPIALENGQA